MRIVAGMLSGNVKLIGLRSRRRANFRSRVELWTDIIPNSGRQRLQVSISGFVTYRSGIGRNSVPGIGGDLNF